MNEISRKPPAQTVAELASARQHQEKENFLARPIMERVVDGI